MLFLSWLLLEREKGKMNGGSRNFSHRPANFGLEGGYEKNHTVVRSSERAVDKVYLVESVQQQDGCKKYQKFQQKKGFPLLNKMRFTRIHKKWLVVVLMAAASRERERERQDDRSAILL